MHEGKHRERKAESPHHVPLYPSTSLFLLIVMNLKTCLGMLLVYIFSVLLCLSQEHSNPERDRSGFLPSVNLQAHGVQSKAFSNQVKISLEKSNEGAFLGSGVCLFLMYGAFPDLLSRKWVLLLLNSQKHVHISLVALTT